MKFLFPLLFVILSCPAWAGTGGDIQAHILDASARWNVPARLLMAIIRQESGGNPWAVNVAGKAYTPRSRAEALKIIHGASTSGKSYDLGLMQVNSAWLKRLNFAPEFALEPKNNVFIGAWILSQEIARYGLTWRAVAAYHTPVGKNPERGRRYAISIIEQLRKIP
jgi:soluble lytic murein transglycosylase-like protein